MSRAGFISKAKWLEDEVVVMGLTDGTLQVKDLRTKTEELPTLLTKRGDSAIMDIEL